MLFVGNLSFNSEEESVNQFFKGYGDFEVRLATTREGRFKGFAHVEFKSSKDASSALKDLNQTTLDGRELRLSFASKYEPEAYQNKEENY